MSIFLIAEIGINHNGSLELAKKMMSAAASARFDAVKFQKRTVEKVYTREYLDSPRESPGDYTKRTKLGLELSLDDYQEIDNHSKK